MVALFDETRPTAWAFSLSPCQRRVPFYAIQRIDNNPFSPLKGPNKGPFVSAKENPHVLLLFLSSPIPWRVPLPSTPSRAGDNDYSTPPWLPFMSLRCRCRLASVLGGRQRKGGSLEGELDLCLRRWKRCKEAAKIRVSPFRSSLNREKKGPNECANKVG